MKAKEVAAFTIAFLLVIILWPRLVIWAINTLFNTGIEFTFWTWLAVVVLSATTGSYNK